MSRASSGRVLCLASILVDLTVDVPRLPERGGDVLASATRTVVGGGFNIASAVARQGVSCWYVGGHGTGPYGDQVRAALAAEGVELAAAARTDGDTGFCITMVEPDGERTFVTRTGVEAELRAGDLAAVGSTVGPGDVVVLSGYDLAYPTSGPVLVHWVSSLAPERVRLALDPGPLVADIPGAWMAGTLPRLWLLSLNQREARLLSRASEVSSGADLLHAVRDVPGLRPETLVVVREAAAGCVATGGPLGDAVLAVPAPAVSVVDTTGAGDTHTGVLVAELVRGTDPAVALERATRAAADSVTRLGPAQAPRPG